MSEPKAEHEKPKSKRGFGIFKRNKPDKDELNEFIIGDIDSKDAVIIGTNGAVAGNISAPSINIKGTIFGSVTSPEIVIDQNGQVWGDVFASAIMITVNAKVHGWISTFDEGTLELIQSGALSAADVMSLTLSAQSDDLVKLRQSSGKEGKLGNPGSQPELYRKFQVEGGSAIIARLELERMYQPGYPISTNRDATSFEDDDRNPAKTTEQIAMQDENNAAVHTELIETIQILNEANAEIVRLTAEMHKSEEIIEQLKSETNLHKDRFRKLAQWVYQNQRAAIK